MFKSTRLAYGRTCIPVRLRLAQFVIFQDKRDSHSVVFSFSFNASTSKNLVRSTARLASPALLQVEVYEPKRLTLAAGRVRSQKNKKTPLNLAALKSSDPQIAFFLLFWETPYVLAS